MNKSTSLCFSGNLTKKEPDSSNKKNTLIAILLSSDQAFNTGVGGHYRSALTLMSILSKSCESFILSYGNLTPPIYNDISGAKHINGNIENALDLLSLRSKKYSHLTIITFDLFNIYQALRFCSLSKRTLIYCKPGGPPSEKYSTYSKIPSILFSGVDYDLFRKKSVNTPLFLFAGRVTPPTIDEPTLAEFIDLANWRNASKPTKGLIICRITADKMDFITQACTGLNNLKNVSCVFVGVAQDLKLHHELKNKYTNIKFITDEKFITNAANCIWGSDFTVAIGRTAQESISTGTPTFIPLSQDGKSNLYLINKGLVKVLIKHNFTQRASQSKTLNYTMLCSLETAINNEKIWSESTRETLEIYDTYLNPCTQENELRKFIEEAASFDNLNSSDYGFYLLLHYIHKIRRPITALKLRITKHLT